MADTQRTRAAILTLFADNVTGQISAQDLRDLVVTLMNSEFVNEGDFWAQPDPTTLVGDREAKGWMVYSQIVDSACSFGDILYLTVSGTWKKTDAAVAAMNGVLCMALESYTAAASQCILLRRGVVHLSAWSAVIALSIGRPAYLDSVNSGTFSFAGIVFSRIIGWVECAGRSAAATSAHLRFDPDWAVVGA